MQSWNLKFVSVGQSSGSHNKCYEKYIQIDKKIRHNVNIYTNLMTILRLWQ